jgi:hypothetical protein
LLHTVHVGDLAERFSTYLPHTIHGFRARTLSTPASKSNSLNFNRHTLRKLLDRDARASGLVSEVLLVDGVHLGEVVHGGDEDVDLKRRHMRKQFKVSRPFEAYCPWMICSP